MFRMLNKLYLSLCAVALIGFTVFASCKAEAHTFPKWAQPEQSKPVQFGSFDESPELYDWQLVLFFHRKTPDENGKVQRYVRAFNHDTKEECEAGKVEVLAIEPPEDIQPDGAVCVPLKKIEFSPVAPNSTVPRLPNGKIDLNKVKS